MRPMLCHDHVPDRPERRGAPRDAHPREAEPARGAPSPGGALARKDRDVRDGRVARRRVRERTTVTGRDAAEGCPPEPRAPIGRLRRGGAGFDGRAGDPDRRRVRRVGQWIRKDEPAC